MAINDTLATYVQQCLDATSNKIRPNGDPIFNAFDKEQGVISFTWSNIPFQLHQYANLGRVLDAGLLHNLVCWPSLDEGGDNATILYNDIGFRLANDQPVIFMRDIAHIAIRLESINGRGKGTASGADIAKVLLGMHLQKEIAANPSPEQSGGMIRTVHPAPPSFV
ncbi:MAG: hypothetical protein AB7G06_03120 [Bdellovibrionales bacterium]